MIVKIIKIFIVAALIVELMIYLLWRPQAPVYAIQQTVEALKDVRNLHIIKRNKSGETETEMWIEINPDGTRGESIHEAVGRYLVLEDKKNQLIYLMKENAVLLNDRDNTFDTWFLEFNALFNEMAKDDSVTVKDINYNGQKFHMVQWLKEDITCFINPETKLPLVVGNYVIYYERWPKNILDKFKVPNTATFLDQRKSNKVVNHHSI